jgi:hypothetical protein
MSSNIPIAIEYLTEPVLEFGYGQTGSDPREGLFLFGPLLDERKPVSMRIGVVGCGSGITAYRNWVKRIRKFIPKPSLETPHHFAFPGYEAAFKTAWPERPVVEIQLSSTEVSNAIRLSDRHRAIHETVSLFAEAIQLKTRQEALGVDLWFVVIPDEVFIYGRPLSRVPANERITVQQKMTQKLARKLQSAPSLFSEDMQAAELYLYGVDFHNQLKARLLADQLTTQIVRESSLQNPDPQGVHRVRRMQDEATIAWNLCTAAFYKACGRPWKLANVRAGVCYLGLAFKKSGDAAEDRNACCGAQMFLSSGQGVVFKGALGPWYSPSTSEFHLSRSAAKNVIVDAIDAFKKDQGSSPSEIFIHGRTYFSDEEWSGFLDAVPEGTKIVGVRIRRSGELKVFRPGRHAVLRGTAVIVSERKAFLWTAGFVSALDTYAGREVPNPLSIEITRGSHNMRGVLEDIMGLTKLNFNSCIFADGLPVTLRFAAAVGEIIVSAPLNKHIPPLPFRHYI